MNKLYDISIENSTNINIFRTIVIYENYDNSTKWYKNTDYIQKKLKDFTVIREWSILLVIKLSVIIKIIEEIA